MKVLQLLLIFIVSLLIVSGIVVGVSNIVSNIVWQIQRHHKRREK